MIRLQADIAELQGLAQMQARRQQPFTGIASQWSASHSGMGPSPLGPLAQANPLPAGLAAPRSAAAMPQSAPAQARNQAVEESVEGEGIGWKQRTASAAQGAVSGAAAGSALGPWGAAAGAVIGGLGGALMG